MSSRIVGNAKTIERAQNAKAGDKTTLINLELINELPDKFEPVLVEVKFKFPDDFSPVGAGVYMPSTDLMGRIAEAKGISSFGESIVEPIYQDVPWDLIMMTDKPDMQRIKVGYSVTKRSCVLQEDGSQRISSPCTIEFNAWDYCVALWMKEEELTLGYTKALPNGKTTKYDNRFKRRAHFYGEQGIKFSQRKAETKSYLKTIRELASLMTGYKKEDLSSGSFLFVKIRLSSEYLRMETAAHLSAISSGRHQDTGEGLFIPQQEQQTLIEEPVDVTSGPEKEEAPTQDKSGELLLVFNYYKSENVIPPEMADRINMTIKWLEDIDQDHTNEAFIKKAISNLSELEASIPEMARKEHGLYEND